jgi:phosphoribosyl 1,2-cyclic phosphodiesterase
MELVVIGSSSHGNGYVLNGTSEALCIEAGTKLIETKKALDFDLSKVRGCIVSHQHNDHAKYAADYACAGIRLLALPDVLEAKGITRNATAIKLGNAYKLGGFVVTPFALQHDVPCVGYVVQHSECGKVVFITDSYACQYRFKGVSHYLLEANYSDEILERNIANGRVDTGMRDRLLTSHFELQNSIRYLQASDLKAVQKVVLIHLSDGNSNEAQFVQAVREATGKRVYAAKAGMVLQLNASVI